MGVERPLVAALLDTPPLLTVWECCVFLICQPQGLIVAVILIGNITEINYPYFLGFAHLASGLSNGLSGLAAGICIGIVGDAGVRATAQQPKLFVVMILILIFAEALALYGLIVALILSGKTSTAGC